MRASSPSIVLVTNVARTDGPLPGCSIETRGEECFTRLDLADHRHCLAALDRHVSVGANLATAVGDAVQDSRPDRIVTV